MISLTSWSVSGVAQDIHDVVELLFGDDAILVPVKDEERLAEGAIVTAHATRDSSGQPAARKLL
eukprot:CAMPEP_0174736910 /NCGR_PEP_ID=MMETSP1094-20130205/67490_1 /TAXON_ID=156173 /ORGANISM="Chrysochromulina brevifilum, Strain UTEX LB 985" /LENGTH=63 /DNA_ID=CAMNT_0015940083 /DNA_START=756 /DNA_END=942 /DNA_ORIENTATION=-